MTNILISKSVVWPLVKPLSNEYVRYRIDFTNTGIRAATNVFISDMIPNGTVYSQGSVRNSLKGSLTDADGDEDWVAVGLAFKEKVGVKQIDFADTLTLTTTSSDLILFKQIDAMCQIL